MHSDFAIFFNDALSRRFHSIHFQFESIAFAKLRFQLQQKVKNWNLQINLIRIMELLVLISKINWITNAITHLLIFNIMTIGDSTFIHIYNRIHQI